MWKPRFSLAVVMITGVVAALLAQSASDPRRSRRSRPSAFQFGQDEIDGRAASQNEFSFARMVYSGGSGWRYGSWATDAPKADITFVAGIKRLTNLDVRESHLFVPFSNEMFKFPFLYAVEVGYLQLSREEADLLREYLLRGGFLVVDDFHGTYEWANFEDQMHKVFPNAKFVDVPLSHPIYHCFFDVEELIQVPGIQFLYSGNTYEKDGYDPHFRGIFDETGRLMVMVNFNSDLGDAWEWADSPYYPEKYSTTAYRLGINYIVYSMTH
ncbi:MAG: DUF4159 domain-containing protein [Acidobacteriota bacterium]